MNAGQFFGYSIYIVGAFLFAISLIVSLGLMLHAGQAIRREPLAWIFVLILIPIAVEPLVSGRNLSGLGSAFEGEIEAYGSWQIVARVANALAFALASERIVRQVFSRQVDAISGWSLYMAFMIFVVVNGITNGLWGSVPQLSLQPISMIVVSLAIIMIAPRHSERLVRFAKSAILWVLVLSVLVAAVKPGIVLQRGYSDGYLPIRFWGLGTHANTLSPLIVCMLCCVWHQPFNKKWLTWLAWGLGSASLLLTQSKTAIAAATVVVAILAFYRYKYLLVTLGHSMASRTALRVFLGLVILASATILVLQLSLDLSKLYDKLLGTRFGGQIATFSSRDLIWKIAYEAWIANPWFGYGPLIFEPKFRLMIGLSQAFHAHNQFMQSLSAAGITGVLGLAAFAMLLGIYGWRAAPSSNGLSLALVSFIVMRSVTEVPLSIKGAINGEFLFLLVTLVVCVAHQPLVAYRAVKMVRSRIVPYHPARTLAPPPWQ